MDELKTPSRVAKVPVRCEMCGTLISTDQWYLIAYINPLGGVRHAIHDNEGICLSKLKVKLGLIKPNFLSSRPVFPTTQKRKSEL